MTKKTLAFVASLAVVSLALSPFMAGRAMADGVQGDASGVVMIGTTRVAASLGVNTEEQLLERLRQGHLNVAFAANGEIQSVEPLTYVQRLRLGDDACPPYFLWICGGSGGRISS